MGIGFGGGGSSETSTNPAGPQKLYSVEKVTVAVAGGSTLNDYITLPVKSIILKTLYIEASTSIYFNVAIKDAPAAAFDLYYAEKANIKLYDMIDCPMVATDQSKRLFLNITNLGTEVATFTIRAHMLELELVTT